MNNNSLVNDAIKYFKKKERSNKINLQRAINQNRKPEEIKDIEKKLKYYQLAVACLQDL